MKKSKFFTIGTKDIIRGFFVAVITSLLSAFLPILNTGKLPSKADILPCLAAGIAGGVAYLLKNLLTNSDDKLMVKEKETPIK